MSVHEIRKTTDGVHEMEERASIRLTGDGSGNRGYIGPDELYEIEEVVAEEVDLAEIPKGSLIGEVEIRDSAHCHVKVLSAEERDFVHS